jgi:hypothetical protein
MSDRYLWDRTGPPDPEIQRLEALLGPFGIGSGQPGRSGSLSAGRLHRETGRRRFWLPLALAAALVIFTVWIRSPFRSTPIWTVETIHGSSRQKHLRLGDSIETNSATRLQLEREDTGQVEVEPNSRLRVITAARNSQKLALIRGKLRATIWAPPGEFSVATPSATATDLGCVYTLETDSRGNGIVRVETGWVALEALGRESFIPRGAECRTYPEHGPGIPRFASANSALQECLREFDETGTLRNVANALLSSTPSDAVSLWHLLRRVSPQDRPFVYKRLASLVPIPSSVTSTGIEHGDQAMIDAIWDSLGYGEVAWWRKWKQREIPR